MTTIKIAKSDLEAALKVAGNTVGNADLAGHYLFRVLGGKLTILSQNNRVFSSCPVVASSDEDDVSFTVEAWRISSVVGATPNNSVLSFEPKNGEVRVVTDRGKIDLSSLDPSKFPFWDSILASANETAVIPADRLKSAFAHARMFVSSDEQQSPQLCVAEFREGVLYSTDKVAVSCIKVEGMEKSSLRVHGKDIGALTTFLDSAKGPDVVILEHERAFFVKRSDGAIFGETLFASKFPTLNGVAWDQSDEYTWDIFREEFDSNVDLLLSGAQRGETKLSIALRDGKLVMGMTAVSGKQMAVDLIPQKSEVKDGAGELPEDGFVVSHTHLTTTLGSHSSNLVRVGASAIPKKGGWVRVQDKRGPDTYLTTISWIKKTA